MRVGQQVQQSPAGRAVGAGKPGVQGLGSKAAGSCASSCTCCASLPNTRQAHLGSHHLARRQQARQADDREGAVPQLDRRSIRPLQKLQSVGDSKGKRVHGQAQCRLLAGCSTPPRWQRCEARRRLKQPPRSTSLDHSRAPACRLAGRVLTCIACDGTRSESVGSPHRRVGSRPSRESSVALLVPSSVAPAAPTRCNCWCCSGSPGCMEQSSSELPGWLPGSCCGGAPRRSAAATAACVCMPSAALAGGSACARWEGTSSSCTSSMHMPPGPSAALSNAPTRTRCARRTLLAGAGCSAAAPRLAALEGCCWRSRCSSIARPPRCRRLRRSSSLPPAAASKAHKGTVVAKLLVMAACREGFACAAGCCTGDEQTPDGSPSAWTCRLGLRATAQGGSVGSIPVPRTYLRRA